MSDEPIVTRSVTITEGPNGITRSYTATVSGGEPWEANTLLDAALRDTRAASHTAYVAALEAHAAAQPRRMHLVSIDAPANGWGRNPDTMEGA